jgi:hypothetical protein
MPRQVPDKILELVLGQNTQPRPQGQKGREKQKKTVIKEGRKSPGNYRNPRGGRYLEQGVPEQMEADVGEMPQPGPTSRGRDIYNERAMRGRDLGNFPKKGMSGVVRDVIDSVGKDKFLKMSYDKAFEIMGIPTNPKMQEMYDQLDPKERLSFWKAYGKDSSNPEKALTSVVAKTVGDPDFELEPDEEDKE